MKANNNYPRFPIYIVSKGRYNYMHTSRALSAMGVFHYIVVENQEISKYISAIEEMGLNADILELDYSYKEKYELLDDHGLSKSTGPGPARNFAWDHSIDNSAEYHWVMDDNIEWFYRFNNNLKTPCRSPAIFRAMEDFVCRYKNIKMAGPNYFKFVDRKSQVPAFVKNTRIYSCNLISNDCDYRWRGRYNEDTILSLDILSAGFCTVQFNAFLQDKMTTQKINGGNTDEFYHAEGDFNSGNRYASGGTIEKSRMLKDTYPELVMLTDRFNRDHHYVNYKIFKQPLKLKDELIIEDGINEYGMVLKSVDHYRHGW